MPSYIESLKNSGKNMDAAIKIVCLHFNLNPGFMKDGSKQPRHVEARQAVWYYLKRMHGYSIATIAELSGKDASTVRSGIERAKELGIPKELGFREP